jgi:hypothetical protein
MSRPTSPLQTHIVIVNALFYASLGVMILAAFIAMLIKSWVREFDRGLRAMSLPEQRAKTREFRYLGMERWKLPEMVGILPSSSRYPFFCFPSVSSCFFFTSVNPRLVSPQRFLVLGFSITPLLHPYQSLLPLRLSTLLFRAPWARCINMCTPISVQVLMFSIRIMDTTPATTLGRVRRRIQIFLQKSRPYLEKTL